MEATLLTAASQELRIPLTVIKGCAATLLQHERRLPRAEQQEFLRTICGASDQLEVALDHLAWFATLETVPLVLRQVPVDLVRVVRESMETVDEKDAGQHKRRQTIWRVRHLGGSGQRTRPRYLVRADPFWLSKAFHFLLDRAAVERVEDEGIDVLFHSLMDNQAQPISNSPRPSYTMTAAEALPSAALPTRQYVLTTIRCASPSAPPSDHIDPSGAPFTQPSPTGGHQATDLGLGFMLCQRIVQLHSGELTVESGNGSESNSGARGVFHVLLPTEEGTSGSSARKGKHG